MYSISYPPNGPHIIFKENCEGSIFVEDQRDFEIGEVVGNFLQKGTMTLYS